MVLKYVWIQLLGRFILYCALLVNRERVVACTVQHTRTARLVLFAVTSELEKKGGRGEKSWWVLQVEKTPAHNKGLFGSIQSEFILYKGSCLLMKSTGKVELPYALWNARGQNCCCFTYVIFSYRLPMKILWRVSLESIVSWNSKIQWVFTCRAWTRKYEKKLLKLCLAHWDSFRIENVV